MKIHWIVTKTDLKRDDDQEDDHPDHNDYSVWAILLTWQQAEDSTYAVIQAKSGKLNNDQNLPWAMWLIRICPEMHTQVQ